MITVTHTFVSPKSEQSDPTIVGPNEWNAQHTVINNSRMFNAADFIFPSQIISTPLTGGITNSITLTPVPIGVNGSDVGHYLQLTCGSGGNESVLITGGTAVSGAASGTITFVPANSHSAGCTISSQSCGILEAVAYGAKSIFFQAGCKWVPANNLVPGGISLYGEDWGTIAGGGSMIESTNPLTQDISIGPLCRIFNVNVHTKYNLSVDPAGVDKWCPVQICMNTSDVNNVPVATYPYANTYVTNSSGSGSQHGTDRTVNIATTESVGSSWYGGSTATGVCFDAQPNGSGPGFRALMGGTGTAGLVVEETSDPGAASIPIEVATSFRTAGTLLALNHNGTSFSGTVISSNICYSSGSFTGTFWDFVSGSTGIIASVMNYNGDVSFGRMFPTTQISNYGAVGGVVITSNNITGIIIHSPTVAVTDTTDTATNIFSIIPGNRVGTSFDFYLRNTGAGTITLAGGTGVTLSGTTTIATGQQRWFRAVVTSISSPAITIYSMGVVTI